MGVREPNLSMNRFLKILLEVLFVGVCIFLWFVIKLFQNTATHDRSIDRIFSNQNIVETLAVIAVATIVVLGFNWLREKPHDTDDKTAL